MKTLTTRALGIAAMTAAFAMPAALPAHAATMNGSFEHPSTNKKAGEFMWIDGGEGNGDMGVSAYKTIDKVNIQTATSPKSGGPWSKLGWKSVPGDHYWKGSVSTAKGMFLRVRACTYEGSDRDCEYFYGYKSS